MHPFASQQRIALLIDTDNTSSRGIEEVLLALAQQGKTTIRRAYGNWKLDSLKNWEACLHEYAITPIQQFDLTKGKNATDMAMTIDAMDLLYGGKVDTFALVSSDSDFTPLVMRLRAEGLPVIGLGRQQTPLPFTRACSEFLYIEQLDRCFEPEANQATEYQHVHNQPRINQPLVSQPDDLDQKREPGYQHNKLRLTPKELKSDTRLINQLRTAIESSKDHRGWAPLAAVGNLIKSNNAFDSRQYGYKKLGDLVRAIDLFTCHQVSGGALYIRDRRSS